MFASPGVEHEGVSEKSTTLERIGEKLLVCVVHAKHARPAVAQSFKKNTPKDVV